MSVVVTTSDSPSHRPVDHPSGVGVRRPGVSGVAAHVNDPIEVAVLVLEHDVVACANEANRHPAAARDDLRHAGRRAVDDGVVANRVVGEPRGARGFGERRIAGPVRRLRRQSAAKRGRCRRRGPPPRARGPRSLADGSSSGPATSAAARSRAAAISVLSGSNTFVTYMRRSRRVDGLPANVTESPTSMMSRGMRARSRSPGFWPSRTHNCATPSKRSVLISRCTCGFCQSTFVTSPRASTKVAQSYSAVE